MTGYNRIKVVSSRNERNHVADEPRPEAKTTAAAGCSEFWINAIMNSTGMYVDASVSLPLLMRSTMSRPAKTKTIAAQLMTICTGAQAFAVVSNVERGSRASSSDLQ